MRPLSQGWALNSRLGGGCQGRQQSARRYPKQLLESRLEEPARRGLSLRRLGAAPSVAFAATLPSQLASRAPVSRVIRRSGARKSQPRAGMESWTLSPGNALGGGAFSSLRCDRVAGQAAAADCVAERLTEAASLLPEARCLEPGVSSAVLSFRRFLS